MGRILSKTVSSNIRTFKNSALTSRSSEEQRPHGGEQKGGGKDVVQIEELGLPGKVEESRADRGHQLKRRYPILAKQEKRVRSMSVNRDCRQLKQRASLGRRQSYTFAQQRRGNEGPNRRCDIPEILVVLGKSGKFAKRNRNIAPALSDYLISVRISPVNSTRTDQHLSRPRTIKSDGEPWFQETARE